MNHRHFIGERCPICEPEFPQTDKTDADAYGVKIKFYNKAVAERDQYKAQAESAQIGFSKLAQAHDKTLAQAEALAEALELILPMARGYALAHQVGNNQAFIEQAEAALAQHKEQVT